MTTKEKAQAYDEALKRARIWQNHLYDTNDKDYAEELNYIFPELKESEDERIRKELLAVVNDLVLPDEQQSRFVSWLEKQGEQEEPQVYETEDGEVITYSESEGYKVVEPKFKRRDWITNGRYAKLIVGINSAWSDYMFEDGTSKRIKDIDKKYHLWTIKDAKDGDVLAAHECFVLFKKLDGLNIRCYCTYHYMNNPSFYVDTLQNKDAFSPATKEQRDLLFEEIKRAGYEWDNEKKELKKFHVIDEGKSEMDYCFTKMMNGKKVSSAWSEEDTFKVQRICKYLDEGKKYYADITEVRECMDWLKSLKNRVQPRQEWSEEDNKWINSLIETFKDSYFVGFDQLKSYGAIDWLKSLKDRVLPQPKHEWNEEDERILDALITSLNNEVFARRLETLKGIRVSSVIDWLKSIKHS